MSVRQSAVKTNEAPAPRGFYSQAVKAGPMPYVAGQLPFAPDGTMVGTTAAEQALQAMRNVEAIVKATGGGIESLVEVTLYVSDVDLWPEVNKAYQEFMSSVPARQGGRACREAALRGVSGDPGGGVSAGGLAGSMNDGAGESSTLATRVMLRAACPS